jgi:hypothetical protein
VHNDLQNLYKHLKRNAPPVAYKNNFQWLSKKVEEITKISYINATTTTTNINNNTTNNYFMMDSNQDETSEPAKKKLKPKADEKDVFLYSLLNKTTPYEKWIKFQKLLLVATDEEKTDFFKRAKGLHAGKPFF